jgi:peptide/nickel transport system permease protein
VRKESAMSSVGLDRPALAVAEAKRRSFFVDLVIRLVKEKPLGTVGAVIVVALFFTGIFANFLAPYGMSEIHLVDRLSPPSAQYILGTDDLGRDLLSRVIFGARISMIASIAASSLSVGVATVVGTFSGFIGGRFDLVVQRFVDAWMAFPGLLVCITVMSFLGTGLAQVIIVIGFLYGISGSRVIRSTVISIRQNVYVEAAVAVGCPTWKLLARHILPNIMAPIIVLFTTSMGTVILVEASLSFLGFGVPPPQPSWGSMLSGVARVYMLQAPWMVIWPGLALSIVVYGVNMLGDAVRDILDPRLRGGLGRYGKATKRGRKNSPKAVVGKGDRAI